MTNLYVSLQNAWFNLRDRQEGQTMAEYALALALVAVVGAAVLVTLGGQIRDALNEIVGFFNGAEGAA